MIENHCGDCELVSKTFHDFLEENEPCLNCFESQDETIEKQYLEIKRLEDIIKEAAENMKILLSNWEPRMDGTENEVLPVGVKCCRNWLYKHEKEFVFPYEKKGERK